MFSAFFTFLGGSTGLGFVVVIIYLIYKGLEQASEPETRSEYNNNYEEHKTMIVDTKRYNEDLQKYDKKITEEMREMGCYTYIL